MVDMITILYGEKKLDPVKYWIETRETGKWWWRKAEYYLHSDYGVLGPFDSAEEIEGCALPAGIDIGAAPPKPWVPGRVEG